MARGSFGWEHWRSGCAAGAGEGGGGCGRCGGAEEGGGVKRRQGDGRAEGARGRLGAVTRDAADGHPILRNEGIGVYNPAAIIIVDDMQTDGLQHTSMPPIDLLGDPASQAYFEMREYQRLYSAIENAAFRRDFHSKLIAVCNRFIDLASSPRNQSIITTLIEWEVKNANPANSGDSGQELADRVRHRHPHGFELLGVGLPPTLEALKNAYRAAVKRHHPDRGGSHKDMVELNMTYTFFENLLLEESGKNVANAMGDASASPLGSEGWDRRCVIFLPGVFLAGEANRMTQILTCEDYKYVITWLLFRIHMDDFAIDEGFSYFNMLLSENWQLSGVARSDATEEIGHGQTWAWNANLSVDLAAGASRLALRLLLLNKRDQAELVLKVMQRAVGEVLRTWGSVEYYWRPLVESTKTSVRDGKKPRFAINHRRQADNALRLNIIDRSKYDHLMAKIQKEGKEGENTR